MTAPTLYPLGLIGITTGIMAAINNNNAGKLVLQNSVDTILATITLNNPPFSEPNSSTGIAQLVVIPTPTGTITTSGTIAKYKFQNGTGSFVFDTQTHGTATCPSHPFVNGDKIYVESNGTLPVGLFADTLYYVVNAVAGVSFKFSLTLGGAALPLTIEGFPDAGIGIHRTNPSVFGGIAGTFAFTADASTHVLACASHPFVNTDTVFVESTDTLPAGLSPATLYYVVSAVAGVSVKLSLTSGGAAINVTTVGSGSHTIYRSNCSLKVPAIVVANDSIGISSFNFDPEA